MGWDVPGADGLAGGVSGEFCDVGFYVARGGVGVEGKFADFAHAQGAVVFGPLSDGVDGFAGTFVAWAFLFEVFEDAFGFFGGLEAEEFVVVGIAPEFAVFWFG